MTWNQVGVRDTICEDPGSHKSMKMSTPAPTSEKGKTQKTYRNQTQIHKSINTVFEDCKLEFGA